MGFVVGELAEEGQSVKGVIIALEDDLRIRRALKVANNIDFYRYEVSFKLNKEQIWRSDVWPHCLTYIQTRIHHVRRLWLFVGYSPNLFLDLAEIGIGCRHSIPAGLLIPNIRLDG
jgi:hypothetical protein